MAFPILGTPIPAFFDTSGSPLASGTLTVQDPADDTNKASYPTYDDAEAATNANDNPLTLNARGEPASGLWGLDGEDYKIVLKDSDGATVYTIDDVFSGSHIKETSAETAAGVTIVNWTVAPGNVLRYGTNTTPGTTDMTTAIQAAIDQAGETGGAPVYIPSGTYLVTSSLLHTGVDADDRIRIYGDGDKSIINSTVTNAPTLEMRNATLCIVERLRFVGDNTTGDTGTGHGVAWTDTSPNSGTFFPNNCITRNCAFKHFRGEDDEITSTTTGVTTTAAGLYVGPGVGCYVQNCTFDTNGQAIHFDETQNSHIENCVIDTADEYGIELDLVGDGCSVSGCDIITCGLDANGDPTVDTSPRNYAGILVRSINKVTITDCKFKNGQAITVFASAAASIKGNYFRCDAPDTVAHTWSIQCDTVDSILIDDNDFEYLAGTGQAISSAIDIDSQSNNPCTAVVTNNKFNHAEYGTGGFDVRYKGTTSANAEMIVTHFGNKHGSAVNGRTNSVVTDCIVFDTCNVRGMVACNSFTVNGDGAGGGGTITDCLDISGATITRDFKVFGNEAAEIDTGATLTNDIADFQIEADTTTNLEDEDAAVNTKLKFEGKMVFNTTTNIPVWAAGSGVNDVWVDATGATDHTPV